ncbi:MAG: hypothetical protein ACX94B_13135 [Henriciella sp.]
MSRLYAEDTKVPVDRSQSEIKKMLREIGADRIAVYESSDGNYIIFEANAVMYKISQKIPEIGRKSLEQRERAGWRALVLLVRAKKVAIQQQITTIEKEFMADTVMPDGSTLLDHHQAIVEHNYGDSPPLLLGFAR